MDARRLRRGLALGALLVSVSGTLGCSGKEPELITLQVGPDETIRFEPKAAFAHYFELNGQDDELRIILASYHVGCMDYRAPKRGEVFVTVTLRAGQAENLAVGQYPWDGVVEIDPDEKEDSSANGGEKTSTLSALPYVRLANEARALPAGGGLSLTTLDVEPFGLVAGELAFRDASPGQPATTALMGAFQVRLCHVGLDPARRTAPGEK